MEYTTYEFYKETWYGDLVDEKDFPKWNLRAGDRLDQMTHGNITEDIRREYAYEIQKAACALIDIMYQIDFRTRHICDPEGGNIKSMSSGSRSVTFGNSETLVDKVLSDRTAQERLLYDTACEHLGGTGLLYAGV